MANDAGDLLQAEQAVQDVLKEPEALKRQVGGNDTAKQSLEGVRKALESLIAKTATTSETARGLLDAQERSRASAEIGSDQAVGAVSESRGCASKVA